MKSTKEIRNREAVSYFKNIEKYLNSESAINDVTEIIESFNIQRKFAIFQDMFSVDYDDYDFGDIPQIDYYNLLDYLKQNIPNILEYKPGSILSGEDHVRLMNVCDEISKRQTIHLIISKLAEQLKPVSLSFDVNKSVILLSKETTNHLNSKIGINLENNTGKFNCNLLPLFDFEVLVRPFIDIISNQLEIVLAFLRYISGSCDIKELSSYIISEMKYNLLESISSFSLSEEGADLSKYPANFYSEEELNDVFFGNDVNRKSLFRGMNDSFWDCCLSNEKINRILLEAHSKDKIPTDILYSFIERDSYSLIPWYTNMDSKSQRMFLLNTFTDVAEKPDSDPIPVDVVTKLLTEEELFFVVKKYYKNLLNNLLSKQYTKALQESKFIEIDIDEISKKVFVKSYKIHLKITEDQLSELKAEILPLLKQVQELLVFKDINLGINLLNFNNTLEYSKDFFPLLLRDYGECAFEDLFRIFDWYPQKYNFLTVYSDAESIATSFETLSILTRLQEGADFEIDYLFFLKFYSGRDWFSNKKKLIEQNLEDICGKEFNLLTEEDSDEFRKNLENLNSLFSITTNTPKFSFNLK